MVEGLSPGKSMMFELSASPIFQVAGTYGMRRYIDFQNYDPEGSGHCGTGIAGRDLLCLIRRTGLGMLPRSRTMTKLLRS